MSSRREQLLNHLWGVLSSAILVRLTLPDPPPDEARAISDPMPGVTDFSLLTAMYQLADGLEDGAASRQVKNVIGDAIKHNVRAHAA